MSLPLGPHQWLLLAILMGLILADAVLAWIKNAKRGTFTWAKFGLFVRKQAYVLVAGIGLAVVTKYGPVTARDIGNVTWWSGAISVGLQYVFGDILGSKLGLIHIGGGNGLPAMPPSTAPTQATK